MFSKEFEKVAKEHLVGGKGDNKKDSEFDKEELKEGSEHEKEHTKNKKVAKEIAKDHLSEDKKYYEKLEKMEKKSAAKGGNIVRAAEHVGLGALMAPSAMELMRKKPKNMTPQQEQEHKHNRFKAGAEVAGLGTLMGAVEAGHPGSLVNKGIKRLIRKR